MHTLKSMSAINSIAAPACCSPDATHSRTRLSAQVAQYKALWLLFMFAFGVSFLAQYTRINDFSMALWMRHSMAALWLGLAFFKFLNREGFAQAYAKYDLMALRWYAWGYVYPFIELGLGIAYLVALFPKATYGITISLLFLNTLGVVDALRQHKKAHCACLGGIASWPIGKVTLVENAFMMGMAIYLIAL